MSLLLALLAGGGSPTGTIAYTEASDTAALAGTVGPTSTLAATEGNDTAALAGAVGVTSSLAYTEAGDTAALAGAVGVAGTLAALEGQDTAAAAGMVGVNGTLTALEGNDTAALTGTSSGGVTPPTGPPRAWTPYYTPARIPNLKPRRSTVSMYETDDGVVITASSNPPVEDWEFDELLALDLV